MNMRYIKFLKIFVIFLVIFSWIFSGFPRIWQNPPIPPEIQEAQAQSGLPVTDNLILRLDADAIENLSDNDPIEQWEDLSGGENSPTQTDSDKRPTYKTSVLDGKPIVRFAGGSGDQDGEHLVFPSSAMGMFRYVPGITVFTVHKYASSVSTRKDIIFFNTSGGGASTRISHGGRGNAYELAGRRLDDDGFKRVTLGTADIDTYLLQTSVLDHSNDHAEIFVDGTSQGDDSFRGEGNTSDTDSVDGWLGSSGSGSAVEFDGDLAEILIYDRALSDLERRKVEQYLGEKWLGWDPLEPPEAPTGFSSPFQTDKSINLTWTKGDHSDKTLIRYREDQFPTGREDGTEAYFDTGELAIVGGLDPDTSYYFRAWGYSTLLDEYSEVAADLQEATKEESEMPVTSGLALHLDASDGDSVIRDGDNKVSQWNDLSGNDRNAVQSSSGQQPLYGVVDGKKSIRFGGGSPTAGDHFSVENYGPMLRSVAGITSFAVLRHTDETNERQPIFSGNTSKGGAATRHEFGRVRNDGEYGTSGRRDDDDSFLIREFGEPKIDEWFLLSNRVDHSENEVQMWEDGENLGTQLYQGVGTTSDTDGINGWIGRSVSASSEAIDADICEILIYDRALSDEEIKEVEQYLGEKWLGWELPVISITVDPETFDYEIMGTSAQKRATEVLGVDQVRVTSDSNTDINLMIRGADATQDENGITWTLSDTEIGENQYMHEFDINIASPTWSKLSTSNQTLASDVEPEGTVDFDLRLNTPSFTDPEIIMNVPVTITAVEAE